MELNRERSYARCIADGWKFLGKNVWMVTKIMAPWYLVMGLLSAILNACSIYLNVSEKANTEIDPTYAYVGLAAFCLFVIVLILSQGRLFLMFSRLSECGSASYKKLTLKSIAYCLVLWILLWTPFFYPVYSWIMKGNGGKISFKASLKKGWNHWGKTFGVVLLSGLIMCAVSIIMMVPYFVATSAYFSSVEGKVNFGDTALIPASGYWTMLGVCAVCYAVMLIFSVAYQATLLYLYGDLKTREK